MSSQYGQSLICESTAEMASLVVRSTRSATSMDSRPPVQMAAMSSGTFERLVRDPLRKKSSRIISYTSRVRPRALRAGTADT